jgi:hypothetical protein
MLTLGLLRRDPAVRAMPRWLLIGAGAASVTMLAWGVLVLKEGTAILESDVAWTVFLGVTAWLAVALYLAFGRVGERCSQLDLGLPLPARRLWLVHLAAVLLSACVVGATAVAVVKAHFLFFGWISAGRIAVSASGTLLPLASITSIALAVVVLQMPHPSLYRVPRNGRNALRVLLTVVGLLGATLGLALAPSALALVPLLLAVILGARTWSALPAGFGVVPREPGEAATPTAADEVGRASALPVTARDGLRERLALQLSVVRVLARGLAPGQLIRLPMMFAQIPFLFLWGMFISGLLLPEAEMRFSFVVLTAYVLLSFMAAPMSQLHVIDPLPISRRWLFAVLVLPGLVTLGAGYGTAHLAAAVWGGPPALVTYGTEPDGIGLVPPYRSELPRVRVPIEHCRIAWDGKPPIVEAPWGESHAPWSIPLFRGSRAVLYQPFSVAEEGTREFMALQLSRAAEAVYGQSIPPEELQARIVDGAPERPVTLGGVYPDLRGTAEGPILPVLLLLIGLIWMLMTRVYLTTFRAGVTDARRRTVFFVILAIALVLHLTQFVAGIGWLTRMWIMSSLPRMAVRRLTDALPGGAVAVWLLCGLLFYVAYRLVRARFERIEAPVSRPGG